MKRLANAFLVALGCLVSLLPALGEEKKDSIPVAEVDQIAAQLGKVATVKGKVIRTGQSKYGIQFLNFTDGRFVIVCFPEAVATFKGKPPIERYRGQMVEITGFIETYRDQYQVKLRSPDQIRILAEKDEADSTSSSANIPNSDNPPTPTPPKKAAPTKGESTPVDPGQFFDDGGKP